MTGPEISLSLKGENIPTSEEFMSTTLVGSFSAATCGYLYVVVLCMTFESPWFSPRKSKSIKLHNYVKKYVTRRYITFLFISVPSINL